MDCDDSIKKLAIGTEARRIAEKINWPKGIRASNMLLGDIYFKCQKNYVKAFEHYQDNVEYSKKNKDIQNEVFALETIAKNWGNIHQHQKSIEYYNMGLALKPGATLEAIIYGNMGISYKAIGDNSKALAYYDSSLRLLNSKKVKDAQDSLEIAGLHLNLSEIYLVTGQPDKAMDQYMMVLTSGAATRNKKLMIWSLIGIGKTYKMKKDYKNAIERYQEALRVSIPINRFEDEVKIYGELANTYMETWDLKRASDYADSSLSLAETQHYIEQLSKCNATLGNIYQRQNKYDVAITYLQKALSIGQQTNNIEDQKDALEGLYNAYLKNSQFPEALSALQNFHALKDSIYNVEKSNELTRNMLTYDFKAKQQLDSVKQAKNIAIVIERQRVLTYSGFVALILVMLLAFFMYRNYKTQKKYNELLSREKKRHLAHIEAQSNILSDIAHIQAHNVRGPVSTILGLVHIFNYDDPADPMNKQVMEWIASTTEKLDNVVKEVIIRENKLRGEHEQENPTSS
jgi:tetratricopeptide (TPR) repeat protein